MKRSVVLVLTLTIQSCAPLSYQLVKLISELPGSTYSHIREIANKAVDIDFIPKYLEDGHADKIDTSVPINQFILPRIRYVPPPGLLPKDLVPKDGFLPLYDQDDWYYMNIDTKNAQTEFLTTERNEINKKDVNDNAIWPATVPPYAATEKEVKSYNVAIAKKRKMVKSRSDEYYLDDSEAKRIQETNDNRESIEETHAKTKRIIEKFDDDKLISEEFYFPRTVLEGEDNNNTSLTHVIENKTLNLDYYKRDDKKPKESKEHFYIDDLESIEVNKKRQEHLPDSSQREKSVDAYYKLLEPIPGNTKSRRKYKVQ